MADERSSANEIEFRDPTDLEPHPLNDEIYADREAVDEQFVESVADGIVEPVVIEDDTIISGHRRVEAAKRAGLDEVPVRPASYDSSVERREAFLTHNEYRERTFSQKLREAMERENIERERARERQGTRTDLGDESTQHSDDEFGKTRDKIAKAVNLGSGRTYQKARTIWKSAQNGNSLAQEQVAKLDAGEQSIHGAYTQLTEAERESDESDDDTAQQEKAESSKSGETDADQHQTRETTISPSASKTDTQATSSGTQSSSEDIDHDDDRFTLYQGDAREIPEVLTDAFAEEELTGAVDVVITSPPYHDKKDYGVDEERQVGLGDSYATYLNDIRKVFNQTYDLTSESGTLWIVVNTFKQDQRVVRLPFDIADICENLPGYDTCPNCETTLQKRRETGRLVCENCGNEVDPLAESWRLQDIIVWDKGRARPWSGDGQFRNVSEYILCFSKAPTGFDFDLDAVRIANPDEFEWWLKYPERYHPRGKTPTSIWEFTTPTQGSWGDDLDHPAPFPPALVERIVKLTTDPGDIVFDPFAGTGTVLAQAEAMGRRPLGLEIHEEYVDSYSEHRKEVAEQSEPRSKQSGHSEQRQDDLEQIICKQRQLKFPRELIRRVRNELDSSTLAELGINTAFQMSHEVIDRQKFDADNLLMETTLYLVVDDDVTEEQIRRIQRAARDCADRPPCSKFGIDSTILVRRTTAMQQSFDRDGWSWEPPYHLYSNDVRVRPERQIDPSEWVAAVGDPDEWRTQHAKNEYPPIISNLECSVNPDR